MASLVEGTIKRLYILDYGLFRVQSQGQERVIGIPGYLIQTQDGQNILVDTGFPAWYADDYVQASLADGLESFGQVLHLDHENLPAGQLDKIGLTPADIDRLVMTHTDIDHVGGIADFPQAPIIISQADRALDYPRYFADRHPISWPEDRTYQTINTDQALCPGVFLLSTPGHAPGHLSLLVRLPESGTILLTGDAISRASEPEEGFAGSWDAVIAQANAERLLKIAAQENAMIVYGHDPEQWKTLRK
ncbi:MAG: N-acyl homoserine lactonase family protein, partial [Chloroflexota bacterium]